MTELKTVKELVALSADASPMETERTDQKGMLLFSAKSLEDYLTCPRRFQLIYLEQLQWPATPTEPLIEYERRLKAGQDFHRLVQRHLLGIDPISLRPEDPALARWWEAYLSHGPTNLPKIRKPEVQVSAPLAGQRITARYDLLAYDQTGKAVIVDWKTSRYQPGRDRLAVKMQTRIYPFLLALAGPSLTGRDIPPEDISLIYWFAEKPDKPEVFQYGREQYTADRVYLSKLINEIMGRDRDPIWELTTNEKACLYCPYRSLCDRGVKAGELDSFEWDVQEAIDLDLDRFDEIAY